MSAIRSYFESALGWLVDKIGVRSVHFEVTQACNQDCVFCYNVWKCSDYPEGQQGTAKTKELIDRILDYRPQVLTFTGGEPLLRSDLPELIRHASKRTNCNLITNGTLMTDDLAAKLVKAGVRMFEFTLLSSDRELHNSLVGRDSFDGVIEAIATVRAAGGTVATTFVAMRQNIETLADTIELNVALGVRGMLFNRFNVGGAGIEKAAELMPSVEQLTTALAVADESAAKYGIGISCGVPFPPCVIDRTPYKNVRFGDCPVGTRRAYPTVDPAGNVRPCNHSPTVLGNLFESDMRSILLSNQAQSYATKLPGECDGCEHIRTCRGGCRAAAEVCGNGCGIDPFVGICNDQKEEIRCKI
jgi:radical SAM protein with 4Fe4S-binding SPASM domain